MELRISPEEAVVRHRELRDVIATQVDGEWPLPSSLFSIVAVKLLGFGFNTYKAIGLLLPDRHYEQGTSLLRTLWETCANFAWVQQAPDERGGLFLGYTAVEYRKYAQRAMPFESAEEREAFLRGFDLGFGDFIRVYRRREHSGRQRWARRFSGSNLEHIVRDLALPWTAEYKTLYPLACQYTHGSPGAILFPLLAQGHEHIPDLYRRPDDQRTTQLALWSMALASRLVAGFLTWAQAEPDPTIAALDAKVGFTRYLQDFCDRW